MKKNQLGRRLFALRKSRGITQEKLAELADYSVDFISLVERGINSPSFEGCERLAKALGISLKDLFDFEKDFD